MGGLSLGLGMGLSRTVAVPSLAARLAALGPLFKYRPAARDTLFQDSAGTVPVTAHGDPVAYLGDLSGNGNHARQTVNTDRRPAYGTDGRYHWIEGDGIDDWLHVTGASLAGKQQATFLVAITVGSDLSGELVHEYGPNIGGVNGAFYGLSTNDGPPGRLSTGLRGDALVRAPYNDLSVGDELVVRSAFDLAQAIPADRVRVYLNGTESQDAFYGVPDPGQGVFSDQDHYLLSRNGTGAFSSSRVYGWMLFDRVLTVDEAALCERLLAADSPAVLT